MLELLWKTSCNHEKIAPSVSAGYCPDCGEYIQNCWYITRCSCCGVKRKSIIRNGKIITQARFCKNCGSSEFELESLDKVDIVTINYAVLLKTSIKSKRQNILQTWIEYNGRSPLKLLPCY